MRSLLGTLLAIAVLAASATPAAAADARTRKAVDRGLSWLAKQQHRRGYFTSNSNQYKVAMTALSGNALLAEGSTTTRGKYARNIRKAVDYLLSKSRENGLIGDANDYHYMYGHGFSMLFLSQVYGEEEDIERREELRIVLTKAVQFCGDAQTSRGGWGYVSAKEGNDFDEGSTCITQVQGLRACRNAGIPVPKQIIDDAQQYIRDCTIKTGSDKGGVQYSYSSRGSGRPPITAAAIACLFNSGDYKSDYVKLLSDYCEKNVWPGRARSTYTGHWHYMHYYYAQVMYRRGGLGDSEDERKANAKLWDDYRNFVAKKLVGEQSSNGAWIRGSHVGPVYSTAINCTILQIDNGFLPIYQR